MTHLFHIIFLLITLTMPTYSHASAIDFLPIQTDRGIAELVELRCNPYSSEIDPESCAAEDITADTFTARIQYKNPLQQFLSAFGAGEWSNFTASIGEEKGIVGPFFKLKAHQKGDKVCYFAQFTGAVDTLIRFNEFDIEASEYLGIPFTKDANGLVDIHMRQLLEALDSRPKSQRHCIKWPKSETPEKQSFFASFVPEVCQFGCSENPDTGQPGCYSLQAFNNPDESRFYNPSFAPVVQCLYEFGDVLIGVNDPAGSPLNTALGLMSGYMYSIMTLFVIITGYKYASGVGHNNREKIKAKDFTVMLIKPVLVLAFFTSDMPQFLYASASVLQREIPLLITDTNDGDISLSRTDFFTNYELADSFSDPIEQEEKDRFDIESYKFTNCLFEDGRFTYAEGYTYLRLWDIIDCKFMQYFGLGYYPISGGKIYVSDEGQQSSINKPDNHEHDLYFKINALYAKSFFLFWHSGGIIPLLAIMTSIFLVMIFFSIFVSYLSSLILLILVFLLSPLLVPLVLLGFTNDIFQGAFQTLIKAILTPAVFTAFFLFALMFLDKAFYGNNNTFNTNGAPLCAAQNITFRDTGATGVDPNKITLNEDCECDDDQSVACLLEREQDLNYYWMDLVILEIKVYFSHKFGNKDIEAFIVQYGRLMIIYAIIFIILKFCQQVTVTLTSNTLVSYLGGDLGSANAFGVMAAPLKIGSKGAGVVAGGAGGTAVRAGNSVARSLPQSAKRSGARISRLPDKIKGGDK